MAKVVSPLFSFSASGALAKSLVYFPWKGIPCVRQWVTPSNPNTDAQQTQRGNLRACVDDIHAAILAALKPFAEADRVAYATLASTFARPRTWFNSICKIWLDQLRSGNLSTVYRGGSVVPGDGTLLVTLYADEIIAAKITTGNFMYGTSKTLLLNTMAATPDLENFEMTATITGLTNGVKYFIQFQPTDTADFIGAESGIFSGVPAVP